MKRRYIVWLFAGTAMGAALLPASLGCFEPGGGFGSLPFGLGSKKPDPFRERLLAIASTYQMFGRSNEEPRWAPEMCASPTTATPSASRPAHAQLQKSPPPHFSESADEDTHGRKLYWLFVKERRPNAASPDQYVVEGEPNPVGQAIVKEAWSADEVHPETPRTPILRTIQFRQGGTTLEREELTVPFANDRDGKLYHADKKTGLFIMYKLDPSTPGTDEGWVYGTVTADGKRVTSSGLVESCMGCHEKAPHDKLFGLAKE